MKIAIMQPYIFPYIGYFQLINVVDRFVIFDDVNYINKGWINRNRILVNNAAYTFTIPLKEASQNKLIKDIEIDGNTPWRNKLVKTIQQSYAKAPHYAAVFPLVKDIIYHTETNLAAFITHSLKTLAEFTGISTEIIPSSQKYPNRQLRGEERIIDICINEGADEYVNSIGGQELYSKNNFAEKGIKLFFVKSKDIRYKQYRQPFVPGLSIIDVLFFCSKEEIKALLAEAELV